MNIVCRYNAFFFFFFGIIKTCICIKILFYLCLSEIIFVHFLKFAFSIFDGHLSNPPFGLLLCC